MGTPFHVELLTPERTLYSGDAGQVSLRTTEGEITFLARHEDFVGVVDVTVVRIGSADGDLVDGTGGAPAELRAAVHGGFVHVDRRGVVIMAPVAELGPEIDVGRARAALAAAEERINAAPSPTESATAPGHPVPGAVPGPSADDPAQVAARRARVRLEAAGATARS
ncbi:MAG: F0F1 ATP synthase subunit epsilon [Acidimicrobiales bacterium]